MSTKIQTSPGRANASRSEKLRRFIQRLLLGAALVAPGAGVAGVAAAQDAFIEITTVPDRYEEGPRATYRGENVYWVDGRWYARHGRRWVYYRDEPRELVRYRTVREVRRDRDYHDHDRHDHHDHHDHHDRDYPRAREYRRERDDRHEHVNEAPPARRHHRD